jgi:very-short-patch-repair endonuclease
LVARQQLLRAGLSRDVVDRTVRGGGLVGADVTTHWGIPVTTPLRTLLDLSRRLSLDDLDAAVSEALVRRLVTLEAPRGRATGRLRTLLETAAPTRSRLERALRRLLREHGLPQPVSNGFVAGCEVDLHWPGHRLIVELDGYGTHGHQRAFESDRVRDQRPLVAGRPVARVTHEQLHRQPTATAARRPLLTPARRR